METAENPKLELDSSWEISGLDEKMGTQKIAISDHVNRFQCSNEESDNFVIEMESFSKGGGKENSGNSRIKRNSFRKVSQCGIEKKINDNASPKAAQIGGSMPEKPAAVVAVGLGTTASDHSSSPQVHHQITITTTTAEKKCVVRRNSFRRTSPWGLDPKRVMLIFATLSSMGTIILIYFTLSIARQQ